MGPSAMHVAGLLSALQSLGHRVETVADIETPSYETADAGNPKARFLPEIAQLCSQLADSVEQAMAANLFPLCLGGDHAQAMGSVAGIARHYNHRNERLGVVWVDAHPDMNTPQTTTSGNIHGMPLAVLLGEGPDSLTTISGDAPALRPQDVVIIGARDVDAPEIPLAKELGVRIYTMHELDRRGTAQCMEEALALVSADTAGIHLSFDLDGIDPQFAPGVGTPVPGGLTVRESHLICEMANQTDKLCGLEVVELNPTLDVRNQTGRLAVWLIQSALGKTIL